LGPSRHKRKSFFNIPILVILIDNLKKWESMILFERLSTGKVFMTKLWLSKVILYYFKNRTFSSKRIVRRRKLILKPQAKQASEKKIQRIRMSKHKPTEKRGNINTFLERNFGPRSVNIFF